MCPSMCVCACLHAVVFRGTKKIVVPGPITMMLCYCGCMYVAEQLRHSFASCSIIHQPHQLCFECSTMQTDIKPQLVLDYSKIKRGIDNLDKVTATYSCWRMTWCEYIQCLCYIVRNTQGPEQRKTESKKNFPGATGLCTGETSCWKTTVLSMSINSCCNCCGEDPNGNTYPNSSSGWNCRQEMWQVPGLSHLKSKTLRPATCVWDVRNMSAGSMQTLSAHHVHSSADKSLGSAFGGL